MSSYIKFFDISQWQGNYNMSADPNPIIFMKASGGDAGLYTDSKLYINYANAKNTGKAIGMYHFAGGGNPVTEAEYFIRACQPLEQDDVFCLDWEIPHSDPVGWCLAFTTRVHELTGAWPLIYLNLSTLKAFDWNPVLQNSGLWVAAWNGDPNIDFNTGGHVYVAHQYIGSPLDTDAWWGTVEQFKKYGYQVPVVAPPQPDPAPAPAPEPTPTPEPIPQPEPAPTPKPEPTPTPLPKTTLFSWIANIVNDCINWLKSWKR